MRTTTLLAGLLLATTALAALPGDAAITGPGTSTATCGLGGASAVSVGAAPASSARMNGHTGSSSGYSTPLRSESHVTGTDGGVSEAGNADSAASCSMPVGITAPSCLRALSTRQVGAATSSAPLTEVYYTGEIMEDAGNYYFVGSRHTVLGAQSFAAPFPASGPLILRHDSESSGAPSTAVSSGCPRLGAVFGIDRLDVKTARVVMDGVTPPQNVCENQASDIRIIDGVGIDIGDDGYGIVLCIGSQGTGVDTDPAGGNATAGIVVEVLSCHGNVTPCNRVLYHTGVGVLGDELVMVWINGDKVGI